MQNLSGETRKDKNLFIYICFMARIAGIKYHKTVTGKTTAVTINLKKWGAELEDFLDKIEIKKYRNEPTLPLEKVIKKLDKKHGIKRK